MPKITLLNIKLRAPAPKRYSIFVAPGLLKTLPAILKKLKPVSRYVIITAGMVKKIAGDKLLQTLKKSGLQADLVSFEGGEKTKNEKTHSELTHAMLAKKCGRDTMILALGGGVVGDMAGYVAATYMRGIPYVQIPTSFLAMVDSSIGGKVGVDTKYGKNLIGAFWHPEAVIADIDCLRDLPEKQLVNGLMEAVKVFFTYDKSFFDATLKNWPKILKKDSGLLQKIIARAVELKIGGGGRDEFDANERQVVNWGHTIGHAIEHLSGYKLLHGYSVALGILVESKIARLLGVLSEKDFRTVRAAMKQFGINENDLKKFNIDEIVRQTSIDKKSKNGKVKYVLLERIGRVKKTKGMFGHEVDEKTVRAALAFFTSQ